MLDIDDLSKGQPGLGQAALFGLCPRCGAATLFAGWVRFAPRCGACGLDFARFNVGDGPAAFLIMIVGALVTGLAIWLELALGPPWWVHLLLWVPLVIGGTVWGLRMAKAALLHSEYRRGGGE
ncbi:DUF983 domain-containing protein [Tsuneonella sp. HG222]